MQDTIIFMNACETFDIKKRPFKKREKSLENLLTEYHLNFCSMGKNLATPMGKGVLDYNFDAYRQSMSFNFRPIDTTKKPEDFQKYIKLLGGLINTYLACEILLDEQHFSIEHYYSLESFLVCYDTGIYQIDPLVFSLNDTEIICFEAVNYETKEPVDSTSICGGKKNNLNLKPAKGYSFFGEDFTRLTDLPVPHIIMEHLNKFMEELLRKRFKINNYSFVSNIFAVSNAIQDVEDFYKEVQHTRTWDTPLKNLCTHKEFEYYSAECMGVLTNINSDDSNIFYHGLILEAAKLHISITQLVNMDITTQYDKVVQNDIYLQALINSRNAPIITHNLFDSIAQSVVYQKSNETIALKIKALGIMNDKRKARNGLLLNVLLYFLTLFGSIGFLEILEDKYSIPFNISFCILLGVFILLGGIWVWAEKRESH